MPKKNTISDDEMKEIDKTASKVAYQKPVAYREKSIARGKIEPQNKVRQSINKAEQGDLEKGRPAGARSYNYNRSTGELKQVPIPRNNKPSEGESTQDRVAKIVKTKVADYPVYEKSSKKAGEFRSAFAEARKAGKETFMWDGRAYNTKRKGEK